HLESVKNQSGQSSEASSERPHKLSDYLF
ncbi:hypothetical protein DFP77_13645, partial [Marinomonas foliarum]